MKRKQFVDIHHAMDLPASCLGETAILIPTRTYNCLRNEGIKYLDELDYYPLYKIKQMKNFGKKCFQELLDIAIKHDAKVEITPHPSSPSYVVECQPIIDCPKCNKINNCINKMNHKKFRRAVSESLAMAINQGIELDLRILLSRFQEVLAVIDKVYPKTDAR